MSDPEELPEWLTFEGLPDDIKWPPLRTSSGGCAPTDWERMNDLAFGRALDDSDYRYLYELAFGPVPPASPTGADVLSVVLGVPADLLDLELTHIQLVDGSWIPKPQGCE